MLWYKKEIGNYYKKAGRLSMLQHGSYTLLMDSCYDRERFPTHEEAMKWTWASSKEEVEAVEFVLNMFFVLVDGKYINNTILEEITKYHQNSKINKKIAIERETKRKENSTNRAQSVNKSYTVSHEPPPNKEQVTSNNNKDKEYVPEGTCQDSNESLFHVDYVKKDNCPHKEIIELYHRILPQCTQVRQWTDARAKNLRARWNEDVSRQNLEYWERFFNLVAGCDFLVGKTNKPFFADLEWILKPTNFVKIREGKYLNRN